MTSCLGREAEEEGAETAAAAAAAAGEDTAAALFFALPSGESRRAAAAGASLLLPPNSFEAPLVFPLLREDRAAASAASRARLASWRVGFFYSFG